jgi:NAD-dependent deacetylase sirtuin 2
VSQIWRQQYFCYLFDEISYLKIAYTSVGFLSEQIFSESVPACEKCNGVVKPDIVFFGENLPKHYFACVEKDFSKCDLLIILGSSLAVQPFASLIDR